MLFLWVEGGSSDTKSLLWVLASAPLVIMANSDEPLSGVEVLSIYDLVQSPRRPNKAGVSITPISQTRRQRLREINMLWLQSPAQLAVTPGLLLLLGPGVSPE